jgi:hypothetical protein
VAPSHQRHGILSIFTRWGGDFKKEVAKKRFAPKAPGGLLPMGKERPVRFVNLGPVENNV